MFGSSGPIRNDRSHEGPLVGWCRDSGSRGARCDLDHGPVCRHRTSCAVGSIAARSFPWLAPRGFPAPREEAKLGHHLLLGMKSPSQHLTAASQAAWSVSRTTDPPVLESRDEPPGKGFAHDVVVARANTTGEKQRILIMNGHRGAGKTTLGRALADHFLWPFISKDVLKEIMCDVIANLDDREALQRRLSRTLAGEG